ncbi:MAG: gamma carbonic anhydrase family protein [Verrucomicrobiota bacterium]
MTIEERLEKFLGQEPKLRDAAFIAQNASIMGDVTLKKDSSIWYHSVLRADIQSIVIGEGSNVQDGTVVHLADDIGVEIGDYTTVGHSAIIHACTIGNECLIGMGSTILDRAEIGARSIIGANTLVTKGMKIPPGSLVYGSPAAIIRELTEAEQSRISQWAIKYISVAQAHARKPSTY